MHLTLIKQKPTSNGQRNRVFLRRNDTVSRLVYRPLIKTVSHRAGRNNLGRITVRHRCNPVARRIKLINWYFRPKSYKVIRIDYDSQRFVCGLVKCNQDKMHYIPLEETLNVDDERFCNTNDKGVFKKLKHIPKNIDISLLSNPKRNHKICYIRSPGTFAKIRSHKENSTILLYPSGQLHEVDNNCYAMIGRTIGADANKIKLGKASASHLIGRRSSSRGIAMNANDHPNGGSYHNKGRQSRSRKGLLAKGGKTRKKSARSTLIKKQSND